MAALELRPVSDALGVEVLGLDLAKPLDDLAATAGGLYQGSLIMTATVGEVSEKPR